MAKRVRLLTGPMKKAMKNLYRVQTFIGRPWTENGGAALGWLPSEKATLVLLMLMKAGYVDAKGTRGRRVFTLNETGLTLAKKEIEAGSW